MDKATMKKIGIVALVLGGVLLFLSIVGMFYGHSAVQEFEEEYGKEVTVSQVMGYMEELMDLVSKYGSIFDDMDSDTIRFAVMYFLIKWRIRFLVLGILLGAAGGLMYAMTNNAQTEAVVQGVMGQIGKTVSDAGSNVARQTKNMTETARLNSAITTDERTINQLYQEIGQAYYQEFVGSEALYQDKLERITELKKGIEEKKEQIQLMKSEPATKTVPVVNTAPVDATVPVANGEAVSATKAFCIQCGKPLSEGANFCTYCGSKQSD